ncbi:MAG: phenylalanine--tRNA ligase subunit beta [bacterium]
MKVTLNWLKEFVDIPWTAKELAERLTMVGLEIASITPLGQGLSSVVIGKITSIDKHPKADRLSLCQVDIGSKKLSIVCGATNIKAGDKVPIALEGAQLPSGVTIKKAKIRGVISEGMLCSQKELGLAEDSSGIYILDTEALLGTLLLDYLNLNDIVIEVEITPNRGDCLSVIGIAREIVAITGGKLKYPSLHPNFEEEGSVGEDSGHINEFITVNVEDSHDCPRYSARVVKDVSIAPSPSWLTSRLLSVGLRPINNVVDITNYILMELGQPLHAFDYSLIKGQQLIIRKAKKDEKIITIDKNKRILDEQMLVIVDKERPIAVAGVMGGIDTEVTENTRNILLESAFFDSISVRRTAKRLGLATEASYRFERGVDPNGIIYALERAASLINMVAGGSTVKGLIDKSYKKFIPVDIALRVERCNKILGTDLDAATVSSILTKLGFTVNKYPLQAFNFNEVQGTKPFVLKVTIPTYRGDVAREIDIIEEVARIYGYNNIKSTQNCGQSSVCLENFNAELRERTRSFFTNHGFYETINFVFTNKRHCDILNIQELQEKGRSLIYLKNPLNEKQEILRYNLMTGLLENVSLNLGKDSWSKKNFRFFEIGKTFIKKDDREKLQEEEYVTGVMMGKRGEDFWQEKNPQIDFYDVKGNLEKLLDFLKIKEYTFRKSSSPFFNKGRVAELISKEKLSLGLFGEVESQCLKDFDLEDQQIFGFCLSLEQLQISIVKDISFKPIPKFPVVVRDLAVIVPQDMEVELVKRIIISLASDLLRTIDIFDVYAGVPILEEYRSIGFSLVFQSEKRTLVSEEVDNICSKIVEILKNKYNISLREA